MGSRVPAGRSASRSRGISSHAARPASSCAASDGGATQASATGLVRSGVMGSVWHRGPARDTVGGVIPGVKSTAARPAVDSLAT